MSASWPLGHTGLGAEVTQLLSLTRPAACGVISPIYTSEKDKGDSLLLAITH